ncbi:MAG: c-type cytochrome domain-containing protein [Sediminibacterium sp.]
MMIEFLGHFHPVIVHLPIGILVLAFILEFLIPSKKIGTSIVVEIALLIAAFTLILSALFGWLLSFTGEYNADILYKHKMLAILLCICTSILWILKKFPEHFGKITKGYPALFYCSFFLLLFTGHFGGSLTHGEDFLSLSNAFKNSKIQTNTNYLEEDSKDGLAVKNTVYDSLVRPILVEKCMQCHNSKKQKGGFQMQTYVLLMKGGKSGHPIVPNGIVNSEFIHRIQLDNNDEKHMPPKAKEPLTSAELNLIYWWINNGASKEKLLQDVKINDTIKAIVKGKEKIELPSLNLQPVNHITIQDSLALTQLHLLITPIIKGSPFLEISAINAPGLNDADLELLFNAASQTVWLILDETKLTDLGIKKLLKFNNLKRLSLKNTKATNQSISAINQLTHLEYLNIVGTSINDAGLLSIKCNKQFKKIYCWRSGITEKGIEKFKQLYPNVVVDFGMK